MKKTRRHYPSYVTNRILREHAVERAQPAPAGLMPMAIVLIGSAALATIAFLMGTGIVG